MKLKSLSQTLGLALLSIISLVANESAQIHLSSAEVQEIFDNPTRSYVYIGRDVSNLADVIAEVSKLDNDENSPVKALDAHIQRGFVIGNYEGVAQALEHAEAVMNRIDTNRSSELSQALNAVVEQVAEEQLVLDAAMLEAANIAPETRACGSCKSHCLKLLIVKEKVEFLNKVKFRDDVTFYDDVRFRDDVRIDDTLSVGDEIINCDLTVGCNISMNDSVSSAIGNIIKGGNRFLSNFGTSNTFVGQNSGNFTMTGSGNSGFGLNTLQNNTAGTNNVAAGADALASNTAGGNNSAFGVGSLQGNTSGTGNTAVGTSSLQANTTGTNNTAVGVIALEFNTIGVNNTAVGVGALQNNTTGVNNTAMGTSALQANTTGIQNTAVGTSALINNTAGVENTAVGVNALGNNTTGTDNTAIGFGALFSNTFGSNNAAVGVSALSANTTGVNNAAVGVGALQNNTIGINNTAMGISSLQSNTTGVQNTAIGTSALIAVTTGTNNIGVGFNAGLALTTGSNNIYIGANAAAGAESNVTRIGGIRGATTGVADAVAVLIDSTGQLGTINSSKAVKHNIQAMNDVSASIYNLNPVTFVYNGDASETTQYGLIAEEVADVFPGIVVRNANGQPETVQYHVLPVLLLNEVKKIAARVAVIEAHLVN